MLITKQLYNVYPCVPRYPPPVTRQIVGTSSSSDIKSIPWCHSDNLLPQLHCIPPPNTPDLSIPKIIFASSPHLEFIESLILY